MDESWSSWPRAALRNSLFVGSVGERKHFARTSTIHGYTQVSALLVAKRPSHLSPAPMGRNPFETTVSLPVQHPVLDGNISAIAGIAANRPRSVGTANSLAKPGRFTDQHGETLPSHEPRMIDHLGTHQGCSATGRTRPKAPRVKRNAVLLGPSPTKGDSRFYTDH